MIRISGLKDAKTSKNILKYIKFFLKNFEMYAPSVAGNSKLKGKITIDNINNIFPSIYLLIEKLGLEKENILSKSFCKSKKKLRQASKLKKLFDIYGSDKSKYHDYHYIYSSIFKNPSKVRKMLEIGIGTNNTSVLSNMGEKGKPGASLKAFRDFFKNFLLVIKLPLVGGTGFEPATYCVSSNCSPN